MSVERLCGKVRGEFLIVLRIAVRSTDETPVRAPKALVLILEFLL